MTSSTHNEHIGIISEDIKVYQAQPEDTEAVQQLLLQTAEWLRSIGSTQWSALLKGEDSHNTPEAIRRGEVFIFKKESILAGMVILMQKASAWDIKLWGDEGHESSIYLHRLAINRSEAGKDLGRKIVDWASSGIHFAGKDRVRLDCIANHEKLNAFYRSCGYEYKGTASNSVGDFNTYEKMVTVE